MFCQCSLKKSLILLQISLHQETIPSHKSLKNFEICGQKATISPASAIPNATGYSAIALETTAITADIAAARGGPKAIIAPTITNPQPAI